MLDLFVMYRDERFERRRNRRLRRDRIQAALASGEAAHPSLAAPVAVAAE
jgi:hypothetical protein